ncbi:hypothetical protein DPMN_157683 [Dreissena polymorpha]|uniref:Uncharacterized protein n=1 Tax=Dreissena polymorpha TaxID=45954 RepID=A0A9D4EHR7_DREPO|nr:hypothetical protein DPMN_157683 [Dreissena polymorpha]
MAISGDLSIPQTENIHHFCDDTYTVSYLQYYPEDQATLCSSSGNFIQQGRELYSAEQDTPFGRPWNYIDHDRKLYSPGQIYIYCAGQDLYSPGPGTLFSRSRLAIQQTTEHTT